MSEKNVRKEVISWVVTIVIAVVLALLIRTYVFNISVVPTGSMLPTIQLNDKILVSRISMWFGEVETGDLVVFKPSEAIESKRSEDEKDSLLVKRVIAKGGETVEIISGTVFINGIEQKEDYVYNKSTDHFGPYTVPDNCYFVMGDNRTNSWDARFWDEHYIAGENIVGKAVYRFGALK